MQLLQHPTLASVQSATLGTPFEGDLYLVGGAVRDDLLGLPIKADFDLVTRGSAIELAHLLRRTGVAETEPVTYERFGTAMVRVAGIDVELITARRESYDPESRKPNVQAATYEEDAARRDFTVNTLQRGLHDGELRDPLGQGMSDLEAKVLRTPLDPDETFRDDPLRMLRAVRFRWKLDFTPAPGLYAAIRHARERMRIVSMERVRDEFQKLLAVPTGPDALQDLMDLGLLEIIAPELVRMDGCVQGSYHHLDVWRHTLLVMRKAGTGDEALTLAALMHDVGKPPTRAIIDGHIRFLGHDAVGAEMTQTVLRRLKFSQREIDVVARLVKNHMRIGTAGGFSAAAARRLIRDLDEDVERLLQLIEADASSLAPKVRALDLTPVRARIDEVSRDTPRDRLESPLTGEEIMRLRGLSPGPEVGRLKNALTEMVIEGTLRPDDVEKAREALATL